ncbi:MAG: hypothetical protein J5I94_17175 [Phaeodactylibacter sp.]|nr:hypothetical protein [Phaeodactylibacter sp.]
MKTTSLFAAGLMVLLLTGCYPHRKANLNYSASVLRDGYLLVRLQSGQKKVAALLEAELFEKAETAAAEQCAKNRSIMAAFDKAFAPCPVYFFYACNTNEILHGQLGSALIFDASRRPVDVRLLAGKPFLVAEVDKGYADWIAATDREGEVTGVAGTNSFDALILRGPDMAPYYQLTTLGNYEVAVEKLSGKLKKYMQGPVELYSVGK